MKKEDRRKLEILMSKIFLDIETMSELKETIKIVEEEVNKKVMFQSLYIKSKEENAEEEIRKDDKKWARLKKR